MQMEAKIDNGAVFAMWYLVTEPKVQSKKVINEFGYRDLFNGVGIFVFVKDKKMYVTALQDLGV